MELNRSLNLQKSSFSATPSRAASAQASILRAPATRQPAVLTDRKVRPLDAKGERPSRKPVTGGPQKLDDPIGNCKVTCAALNVRSGPGANYPRIGGLTKGKAVSVYEVQNGWLKVNYGTKYGWIDSKYTDFKVPEAPETPLYQIKITANELNVRTGPSTSYDIIGTSHKGDTFAAYELKDGWYRIDYNGKMGWVSGKYAEVVGSEPPVVDPGTNDDIVVSSGLKAVAKAKELMGLGWKYSQAKRTENGYYDCSSFCCRCWKAGGYDFHWADSRTMAETIYDKVGEIASLNQAIAGDLLFFNLKNAGGYRNISHVAIATGPTTMIDPGTKSVSEGNPDSSYYHGKLVMIGRPGLMLK